MKTLVLAVGVLISTSVAVQAEGADRAVPDGLEEILQWLPEDSETLFVTRGPFKILSWDDKMEADPDVLKMKLRCMSSGFSADEDGLGENPVELAVEGSRRFRAPKDIGMMSYEGAHVVRFRDDLGPIMASQEKKAVRVEEIDGTRVAIFEGKQHADLWTAYVAQLGPKIMVMATDRGYLRELLGRKAAKGKTRAFPAELPEWKHADTTADFWGIRHYHRKAAANNPSLPLAGGRRAAWGEDDLAVGVVIALKDDGLRVQYLSTNKDALRIAGEAWGEGGDKGLKPDVRTGGPGVVIVSLRLEKDSPAQQGMLLLLLLQTLGRGVYV